MTAADAVLLLNAAVTWIMVGIILFVQRVHYPLFDRYAPADFAATESLHQSRTLGVVAAPMILELLTSLALVMLPPAGVPAWQLWLGLGLVLGWVLITAVWQVPLHTRLGAGFDADLHRQLVRSNWPRVMVWGLRGLLVLVMLGERLNAR